MTVCYRQKKSAAEPSPRSKGEGLETRGASPSRGQKRSRDRGGGGADPAAEPPRHSLKVLLLSGIELAELQVTLAWTGAQLRAALGAQLADGKVVTKLVVDGRLIDDEVALQEVALPGASSTLATAIVQACDFIVEGAGTPQVNGHYLRTEREFSVVSSGAPSFRNEVGTLLFYYRFNSGSLFWYFSDDSGGKDLNKSHGDYYRVKTLEVSPPLEGWTCAKCPLGQDPCPKLRRPTMEGSSLAKAHMEDESEKTSLSGSSSLSSEGY